MPSNEENFPRGCRKIKEAQKRPKRDENLFFTGNVPKAKRFKKNKKTEKEFVSEENFYNSINICGTLSYDRIQEGMIILGCIRRITNFSLEIEFPGLTFGFVHVTNISDAFTKHLTSLLEQNEEEGQDILKKMFKIGQFVAVKVMNIENGEKGIKLKCSLKPSDINFEKSHSLFKKGMLVWGCVDSVLDHGYEINIGVKNCRVFLPSKNVDDAKVLSVGVPSWYVIHKSESTSAATILRVSSRIQHIRDTKIEEVHGLHDIIPGMQIELVTEKITSNGIQGRFINNFFGYIDQTQLKSPLDRLDTYSEGKLIIATVLYVEPNTKIAQFTLQNHLDPTPLRSHKIGDVVSAKVVRKGYNGIYFKLVSNETCFISNRRLIQALPKKTSIDLAVVLSAKFSVGSKHTIRILDYSHMTKIYICAADQATVKEKLFSNNDINVGQLVTVIINSVKSDGLVVTSGHIRGFVPNLHISNTQYSENLKKKFKTGDKVNARVLFIRDDNIIFTLKSGLVESDSCLTSVDVKRGDQFPGVVINTNPTGALVTFYNNVVGWLNRARLESENDEGKTDPTQYFYRGQVVNPWVLGVKGDRVILTLKPPRCFTNVVNLKVGQKVRGVVSKIHKDRVVIKLAKGGVLGVIPVNHLSCSPSLCSTFLKTLKPGDVLSDLLCIDNRTLPFILSRREAFANNRSKKIKITNFTNLRPGILLRCSFVSTCESGIFVFPLILDYTENILVKNADIANKDEPLPKFIKDQSVVAKILSISHETKEMRLTIKYSEVFDKRVETVVSYFSQYLGDIKYLRDFGHKNNWKICQYQPGERIICKVETVSEEGGCLVSLPNDAQGLVPAHLCPENLKAGQSMEGVFLSQDFKNNFVEVCLRKNISQKINNIQDGIISISSLASCITENVLVKDDYVIGILKHNGGNKQLVYIPVYLQENDIKGCRTFYEKDKFKICMCGKVNNYLIGMSKHLFLTLDKEKLLIAKSKSLRNNNKNNDLDKISENSNNLSAVETWQEYKKEQMDEENIKNELMDEDEERMEDVNEDDQKEEREESIEDLSDYANNSDGDSECGIKRKRNEVGTVKNIKFGDDTVKKFVSNDSITGPLPVLPGVATFFNSHLEIEDKSSSDEEEEEVESIKKKKKLTMAERGERAREEEDRLSKIEKELADPMAKPQNAEQFERLLLANPNSSELWIRYISFYIAATELDKARTVAKKALETIDITCTTDRFNIWITLLNLENLFGTKESFDKTFEDAVRYNEPLDIYLNVIKMLSQAEKFTDMEEKIKKVRNKYKQVAVMWLEVGKTYYSIKKFEAARNVKDAALKSINDKRTQWNLIIRFALMEFKYGDEQQGAAIFETILSSDPKKVNIWIIYVDQLIKKDLIEQARKVLERSICQRLPLKKMKALFLKFKMFEEQHGTPDSVEAVKRKAAEYFKNTFNG